jgi:hypothetical protein
MQQTTLSVVITSNKNSLAIRHTLESLIDRGIDNVQYLVNLDNYEDQYRIELAHAFPDVEFYHQHGTLSETINHLISKAEGDYIARSDDDDIYINRRLFIQKQFLDVNQEIDVVGSDVYFLHQGGGLTYQSYFPTFHQLLTTAPLAENYLFANGTTMARSAFFKTIQYAPIDEYLVEDFNLWIKGICQGFQFGNINIPLMIYRLPAYSSDKVAIMRRSCCKSSLEFIRRFLSVEEEVGSGFVNGILQFKDYGTVEPLFWEHAKIIYESLLAKGVGRQVISSSYNKIGYSWVLNALSKH